MTAYFHACVEAHEPNALISTGGEANRYWQRLMREGKIAANEALDHQPPRPDAAPSRRTCVFAAFDPGFALAFAIGEGMTAHLYEVEPIGITHAGPMFLTSAIATHLALPPTEMTKKVGPRDDHRVLVRPDGLVRHRDSR